MNVETLLVKRLIADPENVRIHSEKNLEAIKGSLAKFGQQKPIVVGKGNVVIAGSGTLLAARALGWKKIEAVRSKLRGSDATAYGIADNRTTDLSEFDTKGLNDLIASLHAEEFDLSAVGYADYEVQSILDAVAAGSPDLETQPVATDEVETEVPARTALGDEWKRPTSRRSR